ncbi:MAG: CHAD domain-containing protein [Planctomycetota bacterium]
MVSPRLSAAAALADFDLDVQGLDLLLERLQHSLRERSKRLAKRWKTVRRNGDQDAVHDLRVACRRLLSVLDLVRALDERKTYGKMRRNLKSILKHYSRLRDAQVQFETLAAVLPGDGPLASAYRRLLDDRIESLRRKTVASTPELDFKLCRKAARKFAAFVEQRRSNQEPTGRPLSDAAQALVAGLFASFDDSRQQSLHDRTTASFHQARIRFKKFRYAVEVLRPILPGVDRAYMERLTALQTAMGAVQDLAVLREHLADFAASPNSPGGRRELARLDEALGRKHERALGAVQRLSAPWEGSDFADAFGGTSHDGE